MKSGELISMAQILIFECEEMKNILVLLGRDLKLELAHKQELYIRQ